MVVVEMTTSMKPAPLVSITGNIPAELPALPSGTDGA
jgi:hypothetical protein